MSLDPSWISTIFGLVILIGEVLSAMCFAVVVERILFNYKPMSEMLKPDFVHDHGKWMLTFIMVWAYFSFSQWLIIWAGNLPSEITFYLRRLSGGWGSIGLMLVIFHFAVPFATLLSRPFKRNIRKLVWLAVWSDADAIYRSVLDYRAQFFEDSERDRRRHRCARSQSAESGCGISSVTWPRCPCYRPTTGCARSFGVGHTRNA